jgi:phosphoribosylamine--glycine ligase
MKLLVLGYDGYAHALTWKLFNSPQATDIICAPGNGGTSQLVPQLDIDVRRASEIAHWAFKEHVDLIVPASSEASVHGLANEAVALHIGVCGPPQRAARLLLSRCAAKELLLRHNLPTAHGQAFQSRTTAEKYLAAQPLPVVLKADHPALGGGIYHDRYSALTALRELFEARPLEGTNDGVVIEALLSGMQVSFSAFTDGQTAVSLLPARLYDRLNDGDAGPYAPGMGACTGTSTYTRKLTDYLHQRLMLPTVAALRHDDLSYWGILGLDCIVTPEGPRIVTLRSDMRDMEAQVVLPRLEDDLMDLVQATIARRLDQLPPLRWREEASVGIALVVQGYPNHFPVGSSIQGLPELEPGTLVFHDQTHNPLGLEYQPAGHRGPDTFARLIMGMGRPGTTITTTGGHVLTVVGTGATLDEARARALQSATRIDFAGRHFRHDIGAGAFGERYSS